MELVKWKFKWKFKWKSIKWKYIKLNLLNGSSNGLLFKIELCYDYRHRQALQRLSMTSLFRNNTTKKSKMIITDKDFLDNIENELVTLSGLTKVVKTASWEAEQQKGDFGLTASLEILQERLDQIKRLVMNRQR